MGVGGEQSRMRQNVPCHLRFIAAQRDVDEIHRVGLIQLFHQLRHLSHDFFLISQVVDIHPPLFKIRRLVHLAEIGFFQQPSYLFTDGIVLYVSPLKFLEIVYLIGKILFKECSLFIHVHAEKFFMAHLFKAFIQTKFGFIICCMGISVMSARRKIVECLLRRGEEDDFVELETVFLKIPRIFVKIATQLHLVEFFTLNTVEFRRLSSDIFLVKSTQYVFQISDAVRGIVPSN